MGQEPAIHQILINNCATIIRPNLFHALQRIRAPYTDEVRLWVDSLCIDQLGDLERNEQVQKMAQIYNKADHVIIWLGDEDSTSRVANDLVDDIYNLGFLWSRLWWQS